MSSFSVQICDTFELNRNKCLAFTWLAWGKLIYKNESFDFFSVSNIMMNNFWLVTNEWKVGIEVLMETVRLFESWKCFLVVHLPFGYWWLLQLDSIEIQTWSSGRHQIYAIVWSLHVGSCGFICVVKVHKRQINKQQTQLWKWQKFLICVEITYLPRA